MSDLTNVFTDIADAIRAKTETQITYKPTEMADAINNISSGGGALVYDANGVSINQWLNVPVTIAEGVTNTARLFSGCYNFNQAVTIPDSVIDTTYMFSDCRNFNQPVTIPNNVTNSVRMFQNCVNFNQPITIPNNITNTAYMFSDCSNFNQPITIPNSVTNAVSMLLGCYSFNQPITIPNNVSFVTGMFLDCNNFNQYIDLVRCNAASLATLFSGCVNFNQPVIISKKVSTIQNMLASCSAFESDIIIPKSSQFSSYTMTKNFLRATNSSLHKNIICNGSTYFRGTATSNSITGTAITWTQDAQDGDNYYNTQYNITIMDNAVAEFNAQPSYAYYFKSGANASEIKPAMVFGDAVNNMQRCFADCSTFDSYVVLGNNVQDMSYAFQSTRFNKPIVIPESVTNLYSMLYDCAYFGSSIIFRNTANLTSESVAYMLRDTDDDKYKTIICDNAQLFISSELFTRPVEWTEIDEGLWFNATVHTTIKQI